MANAIRRGFVMGKDSGRGARGFAILRERPGLRNTPTPWGRRLDSRPRPWHTPAGCRGIGRGGRAMTQLRRWACGLAVLAAGCASRPPLENPVLIRPTAADAENPILVTPGAPSATTYAALYEHVLD